MLILAYMTPRAQGLVLALYVMELMALLTRVRSLQVKETAGPAGSSAVVSFWGLFDAFARC